MSTPAVLDTNPKVADLLIKLSKRYGSSAITSPKHNITSEEDLHSIVNTRFMKEMTTLLFWLPKFKQCEILEAVSKTARCSVSDIVEHLSNLTEIKHNVNVSCPVQMSMKYKSCSQSNKSLVEISIGNELLKVFDALPAPFKCHVINTIALVYHLKSRRHLANRYLNLPLNVSEAQKQLEKMYPFVSLPQTCANMGEILVVPSIPPVNITVNLTNGNQTAWLKHLSKKGPDIFRTVLEYKREAYHKGVLGPGSTQQYLEENKELIDSTKFVTVSVQGSGEVFSVLFRLKGKRKQSNHLREIKSTYKIVQALAAKNQKKLRTIFNATIIAVSLSGERSNSTKTPAKENKWNLNKINKAQDFFPVHLSEYFKQLGKPARCFVVFYISKKMKKSPEEMEMFYNSYKRFSRKHTCYYTWRAPTNTIAITIPSIIHERNSLATLPGVPTVTEKIEVPSKGNESAIKNISEKVVSEDLSALEITLFTLLGLFCVTILAFTVNCVISALRAKPKYQNNGAPNGVNIPNAVFLKATNTVAISNSGNGGVKSVDEIQRNGRHNVIQPPDTKNPPRGRYNISVNTLSKLYLAPQPHRVSECDDKKTGSEHSQSFHDSDEKNNSSNTETQKQNEYCFRSLSQVHKNDNAVMESPWKKRFSCKTTCHRTRKKMPDHSVLDSNRDLQSPGKAISYCRISDTNSKAQPHRTVHPGSLPSEEVHETVVVMLECKEIKEEQV